MALFCVLARGDAAMADRERDRDRASIQRALGRGDLGAGVSVTGEGFSYVRDGLRIPLDIELGAAAGGFRAYASSADAGATRAWFHPPSNHWVVADDSGLRRSFGTGPESRAGPDVHRAAGTSAWHLTRVEDPSGNSVTLGPRDP
jgi:hypothetical protein